MKFTPITLSLSGALFLSACSSSGSLNIIQATTEEPDMSTTTRIDQSSSLNLKNIASRVSNNNPQIRAAKGRILEAQGQVVQSGRLTNPQLQLSLNKNVRSAEGGLQATFAQRFPVTNRLHLEKRISKQQLSIAKEEVKVAQTSLSAQAQETAVKILYNRQRVAALKEQISLLDNFAKFIEQAAEGGELSILDANQAKVQSSTLKAQIIRVQTQEKILLNDLKGYIGIHPSKALNLSGSLPKNYLPSASLSLTNRPEYRAKLLEIEQAKQSVALQKANRYQDIQGSLFTSLSREEDEPIGIETEGVVGAGVSIPLQFYNKNEGNIQSARARATRIVNEKEALALQIKQQVASERAAMKGWLAQINKLNNTLIPLANENAEQLEVAFRNGQAPFTSVLMARTQQLKLQTQNLSNSEEFHKARVRYFAAIGRSQSAL